MKRVIFLAIAAALAIGVIAGAVLAQQAQAPQPFFVGNRLGLPVNTTLLGSSFRTRRSNISYLY